MKNTFKELSLVLISIFKFCLILYLFLSLDGKYVNLGYSRYLTAL